MKVTCFVLSSTSTSSIRRHICSSYYVTFLWASNIATDWFTLELKASMCLIKMPKGTSCIHMNEGRDKTSAFDNLGMRSICQVSKPYRNLEAAPAADHSQRFRTEMLNNHTCKWMLGVFSFFMTVFLLCVLWHECILNVMPIKQVEKKRTCKRERERKRDANQ